MAERMLSCRSVDLVMPTTDASPASKSCRQRLVPRTPTPMTAVDDEEAGRDMADAMELIQLTKTNTDGIRMVLSSNGDFGPPAADHPPDAMACDDRRSMFNFNVAYGSG